MTWNVRFSLFLTLSAFVPLSGSRAMDLKEAVQKARAHSPAVQMYQAQGRAARSVQDQVRMTRMPSVSLNSNLTRGDDPVYVFGSLLRQGRFGAAHFDPNFLNNPPDQTNYSNALTAGFPLFTGFELSGRSAMATAGQAWARAGEVAALNQIDVAVSEAYLDAIKEAEIRSMMAEVVTKAESDVADADRLMKRGLVLGSDYYAARAILDGLKAALIQTETAETEANLKLAILTGIDVGTKMPLIGRVPALSTPTVAAGNISQRPDLQMAAAQIDMAQAEQKIQSRSFLPDVMAFGSLETNTDDFSKNPSHHMAGLKMDVPLGDPAYFARKGESRYKLEAAQRAYDQARDNAAMEIQILSAQLRALASSAPLISSSRRNAERSLDMFRPLYREGRQSVMEVLRAEDAVVRARRAELDMLASFQKVSLRLEAAKGPLAPDTVGRLSYQMTSGEQP